jgi:hypothetical protein
VVACDEDFSEACHIVDGMCRDPEWTPSIPRTAADARIDSSVDGWLEDPWGPMVWTVCDGGAIAWGVWGLSETAEIEVYDGDTREWIGGYVLTDDPWPVCGTEIWVGDEAWFACGTEVYGWVQQQYYLCQPGATGATVGDCLRDEVPR